MEIKTPEEILGISSPPVMWHHGTCDMCNERLVLVLHFNYDVQPERDFRICEGCFEKHKPIMDKKPDFPKLTSFEKEEIQKQNAELDKIKGRTRQRCLFQGTKKKGRVRLKF